MRPDYCPIGGEPCQSLCGEPCRASIRAPLTDLEIVDLMPTTVTPALDGELLWFARAIERAHGSGGRDGGREGGAA